MTTEQKGNLALAVLLILSGAMNIWATVQTNHVREQINSMFCVERQ
jgi:hypothetical protein